MKDLVINTAYVICILLVIGILIDLNKFQKWKRSLPAYNCGMCDAMGCGMHKNCDCKCHG